MQFPNIIFHFSATMLFPNPNRQKADNDVWDTTVLTLMYTVAFRSTCIFSGYIAYTYINTTLYVTHINYFLHSPTELDECYVFTPVCVFVFNVTLCDMLRWCLYSFITLSKVAEMFSEIASSHVTLFIVDTYASEKYDVQV